MASFQAYIPLLDKVEGGYQNLSNDRGNYNSLGQLVGTNFGISAQTYELWIKRPPSVGDMKNMLKSTALTIYKNWFWNALKADFYTNQSVANIIVDHGVNAGVVTSAKILQKVLNESFGFNLIIDGIIGNKTITALNSVNQSSLHQKILEARIDYYKKLGGSFLQSWLNRLKTFFFQENVKNVIGVSTILVFALTGYLIFKKLKK
jgi:lysozyme family protein